jgi:hypothetical protein
MKDRWHFQRRDLGEKHHKISPKNVEDITIDVMENNKIIEMFQAMAIVRLKMGNLGLEVKSLETKFTMVEGEK